MSAGDARRWFDLPSPFAMKRGGALAGARLAYETWGELSPARDNALLILTGLSPSAHAASNAEDPAPGWWEDMVGPGKPIDSGRWFVVCVNTLGSCKGSTGPASIDPARGVAHRLDFPESPSRMPPMPPTRWSAASASAARLPGRQFDGRHDRAGLPGPASRQRAHPHQRLHRAQEPQPFAIAIRSLQREAIRLDPNWNEGRYDDAGWPVAGMSIARKLGVITYRSAMEWVGRFARIRLDADDRDDDPFAVEFAVESYLQKHADRFIRSFDEFLPVPVARERTGSTSPTQRGQRRPRPGPPRAGTGAGARRQHRHPVSAVAAEEIAEGLRAGGTDVEFVALDSPQGHDAFLVDIERFGAAIAAFLAAR